MLASGKFSTEIVEQVLAAAATRQRHIGEADVREIAKAGAKAAILQGIEADQKAEAARLLSLAKAKGFDTWEAACEADRVKWEAAQQAEEAEAERKQAEVEAILDRGPDPDLPPTSEPVVASSEAFHVATFEEAGEHVRFGKDIAQRHRTNHRIFAGGGQADRRKTESSMIDHAHITDEFCGEEENGCPIAQAAPLIVAL